MKNGRVTKFRFRACAACQPCSQASLCLYTSSAISIRAKLTLINSSVTLLEENAPFKLPARHCSLTFFPSRLDFKIWKMGVSLAAPLQPKLKLQSLPTTLRIQTLKPIPSYSKASGVFSSRYRYTASSRHSHFHRASRWDSSPVVTPFVRSGTYPERNCATLERL